ncbi:hypothetical protein SLEP1_g41584 [Rubroshorea leprosula]|uniref:Uncharacterized protein n=1 Tax=Rubroshorea leprosula TaxID=152421 RepID=A0AAV5L6Z8_9ROSI|nr:hypothetical protein SLEP1_g41584 [Rubroshorea leprosula]
MTATTEGERGHTLLMVVTTEGVTDLTLQMIGTTVGVTVTTHEMIGTTGGGTGPTLHMTQGMILRMTDITGGTTHPLFPEALHHQGQEGA